MLTNQITKKAVASFAERPSHALAVIGPDGSGKLQLATSLAARLLELRTEAEIQNYSYYTLISRQADKQDISVAQIRTVLGGQKLKTLGTNTIRRVTIIANAQFMNDEAQNMLLKSLEEPSADTVFILTINGEQVMLPTIYSRCQTIKVAPIGEPEAIEHYSNKYSEQVIKSAWQLSQGYAGLLETLLSGDDSHPLRQAISVAKEILTKNRYEKLLAVDAISKDKQSLVLLLDALARVSSALHRAAAAKGDDKRTQKFLLIRKRVYDAQQNVAKNAQPKLALTDLMLTI